MSDTLTKKEAADILRDIADSLLDPPQPKEHEAMRCSTCNEVLATHSCAAPQPVAKWPIGKLTADGGHTVSDRITTNDPGMVVSVEIFPKGAVGKLVEALKTITKDGWCNANIDTANAALAAFDAEMRGE